MCRLANARQQLLSADVDAPERLTNTAMLGPGAKTSESLSDDTRQAAGVAG